MKGVKSNPRGGVACSKRSGGCQRRKERVGGKRGSEMKGDENEMKQKEEF